MAVSSNKPSHLRALLKKNWILWKRSWCVSLCEFLIPFVFALLIIAFKQAATTDEIPTITYHNKASTSYVYDGTLNTDYFKDCKLDKNAGLVAIVPPPIPNTLGGDIDVALRGAGFKTEPFDSTEAIDDYTTKTNYATLSAIKETLCFAVVINRDGANNKYEYMLRFNISGYENPDLPDTSGQRVNNVAFQDIDSMYDYGHSGFLSLQNFIDNLILQRETLNTANIKTGMTSRTVESYTDDQFATNMKGQIAMFVALPLLLPYLRFMNGILTEKEKKIREGMKIMGLKNSAFYMAWFITYFMIFTLASLLVSIALKGIFKESAWILIFLWHWEFSMTLMAMGFLITTFFSKAKVGNVAGFVVALFLSFIQSVATDDSGSGVYFGISFAPQTSLSLSADHMLDLEAAQVGLTSDTIDLKVNNYQMSYHYIVMLLDFFIFIILGSYFDKVLPSEFGIRSHPLFCLMRNKKSKNQLARVDSIDRREQEANNFEQAGNAFKAQDEANESIKVQGLRKVYDTGKVAVDNVSFNMYKGQIFALLGHNGAGKTTTISMMTGLFDSSSGSTKIFGLDIQESLDEIRKTMGICPQHDILFDNITVKEHLEMYAVFKGVNAKDIASEVEKTIEDIGLGEKRDYLSKNLSGGQKRKLSIGMAFIGGSKFILLDEPSSGMDTSARRKLWDMLKNYKHDRVVLLTTHFMDEADYLGDRIGIMAEGQLKCLGSPLFLKSKFGIGYNLTMVKNDINVPSGPIRALVQKYVPESQLLSDVSAEFALQLPLNSAPKFQTLFDELDKNLKPLGISSYGVSVTTLEEVFLNVAKINAPEKHYKKKDDAALEMKDELDEYNIEEDRIKGSWTIFKTHFKALVKKRIQYTKRDKRGLICELLLPILMVIGGIIIANSAFDNDVKVLVIEDSMYDYTFQMDYNRFVPAGISAGANLDPNFLANLETANIIQKGVTENTVTAFDLQVVKDQGPILQSPVNVFSFLMEEYEDSLKTYDYTVFIDTRAQEGSAYAMNKINNAILKTATGNKAKSITVVNSPFLKTAGAKSIDQVFSGLIYAFVLSIAMSLLPASLITYIVKEREFNAKHQQIVSGVSITAYWFSNFFVDIIKYMIPAVINALLAMAMDASALIDGDKLGAMWLDFILYGFAIVPFVYLTAFLFKNYGTAQIASFFFNFCTGFILGLAASIFKLFDSTRSIGEALQWIFRPLPSFSMTFGFINLANRDVYTMVYDRTTQMSAYDMNLTGGDLLVMALSAIAYMILIFVVESLKNKQGLNSALSRETSVAYVPKKMDEDVEKEQKEVEASDNKTYSIKVDKLRKVYPIGKGQYKVAVDQLSFGVKNGECFALLGVNGAGKTTTFKILSGDYTQTSGRAHINGFEIPQRLAEAQRNIGYCPQFDSILELLTAKEHLHLYAAIKGIPESLRGRMVEKQLVEMNLKQYENIPAGTYSGGNKRKLSVAIAMIGNPAVVFLDEPSTGMDPEARRFMWNVISRISRERKQSSIILTTHSMEEAEALATKMGIMVNGNLKCLGTSQHIKNKFGGGYEIEVKLELPTKEEVKSAMQKLGPQLNQDTLVNKQALEVLQLLNAEYLRKEVKEDGAGSAIFSELKKGKISTQLLVEWVLIEKAGEQLKEFFKQAFGQISVIEHFQSFYRFKASNQITIGSFFGLLEKNKSQLQIQQYSIKQGSIEQIFNNFAAEEHVNGVPHTKTAQPNSA